MADESELGNVVDQMAGVVENLIEHSLGESAYAQAIECVKVIRGETSDCELPEVYNNFVQTLKKKIVEGELNGNRKDFLTFLRKEKLGLITKDEDGRSELDLEDANKVGRTEGSASSMKKSLSCMFSNPFVFEDICWPGTSVT